MESPIKHCNSRLKSNDGDKPFGDRKKTITIGRTYRERAADSSAALGMAKAGRSPELRSLEQQHGRDKGDRGSLPSIPC